MNYKNFLNPQQTMPFNKENTYWSFFLLINISNMRIVRCVFNPNLDVCACVCVCGCGWGGGYFTPCWFFISNSAVTLASCSILLETFVPNLEFLTQPSLQILDKTQTRYFWFPDFWSMPYKRKLSWLQNKEWY